MPSPYERNRQHCGQHEYYGTPGHEVLLKDLLKRSPKSTPAGKRSAATLKQSDTADFAEMSGLWDTISPNHDSERPIRCDADVAPIPGLAILSGLFAILVLIRACNSFHPENLKLWESIDEHSARTNRPL